MFLLRFQRSASPAVSGEMIILNIRIPQKKYIIPPCKDPTLSGNYHPISLLSIFYKLAGCAITQRIKPTVESIVGGQQKAINNFSSFIDNLIKILKYVYNTKKLTLILLIDFKKAFNSNFLTAIYFSSHLVFTAIFFYG